VEQILSRLNLTLLLFRLYSCGSLFIILRERLKLRICIIKKLKFGIKNLCKNKKMMCNFSLRNFFIIFWWVKLLDFFMDF